MSDHVGVIESRGIEPVPGSAFRTLPAVPPTAWAAAAPVSLDPAGSPVDPPRG